MSDATDRINNTLAFLPKCGLLTKMERDDAHQLAVDFINSQYPPTNAKLRAYEEFSNGMSLGSREGKDPDDNRNRKRAAYLLDRALFWASNGAALGRLGNLSVGQIIDPQVTLENYLRKAANQRGNATGSPLAANEALTALYEKPLEFLRTNKLIVVGSPKWDLVNQDYRNILPFYFGYVAKDDRFQFNWKLIDQGQGACVISVDSVPAQYWTSIMNTRDPVVGHFAEIPAIQLASQFMVTTQFTGCAFCMKSHDQHTYCAHIVPQIDPSDQYSLTHCQPLTGNALARRIMTGPSGVHGDFANAPGGSPLSVYGAGFSDHVRTGAGGYPDRLAGSGAGNYMTVIGVKRAPGYEIYSQITQNEAITSAQQIF